MNQLKKTSVLLMVFALFVASRAMAQPCFALEPRLLTEREMEIIHDDEYTMTGNESGNFYCNPLLLNGKPLDYNTFNVGTKGELTVIKGAPVTARTIEVPFHAYLRRDGIKIFIPTLERFDITNTRMEISEILKYAKPGDLLIIEAVRREDSAVKRILKVIKGGC